MTASSEKLSHKQEQAIAALLSEATISAAAEKVGVGEVTVHRWLKLSHFVAAYREARRQAVEKGIAQLQQANWAAATTLIRLLGSGSDSVKLRAAQTILDHSNKGVEFLDFEQRLAALEQKAEEDGGRRR
jgi:transposase-like protein